MMTVYHSIIDLVYWISWRPRVDIVGRLIPGNLIQSTRATITEQSTMAQAPTKRQRTSAGCVDNRLMHWWNVMVPLVSHASLPWSMAMVHGGRELKGRGRGGEKEVGRQRHACPCPWSVKLISSALRYVVSEVIP